MFRMLIAAAIVCTLATPALAQPPADALGKCLAENTTGRDRKDLAKWIFFAIAAHPDMKPYTTPSAEAGTEESSRTLAALVTRLLTVSCAKETRAVALTAGPGTMQTAFSGLGQLAMQELMTEPTVTATMSQFSRYLDQKAFTDLMAAPK